MMDQIHAVKQPQTHRNDTDVALATCRGTPRWMRGMRQIKTALGHEPL